MQLIDNDELAFLKMPRITSLSEHHRKTFRSRNQNMRPPLAKLDALGAGRIAGPQRNPQLLIEPHSDDRRPDIFSDIVSQRAQGRDVDALHGGIQGSGVEFSKERVEDAEKSGQGFPTA